MKKSALTKSKKVSLICLVLFLIGMAIASIVSQNMYYEALPTVTTGAVSRDKLTVAYHVSGTVAYKKQSHRYYADSALDSVEFLVKDGAAVTIGEPIYKFSASDVLLAQKKLELSVLQLQEEGDTLDDSEAGLLLQEINRLEIEQRTTTIDRLAALYQNDGVVSALQTGVINFSAPNYAPVLGGQQIAAISANTSDAFVSWQLPAEDAKLFHAGDEVSTTITIQEITDDKVTERNILYPLRIAETELLPAGAGRAFTANIGDDVTLSMEEGAGVTVSCTYTSKESYPYVVPLSAVYLDENGSTGTVYTVKSRDRVFGKEYYAAAHPVEITRRIGNYAALTNFSEEDPIVVQTTLPLTDNMAVKLNPVQTASVNER